MQIAVIHFICLCKKKMTELLVKDWPGPEDMVGVFDVTEAEGGCVYLAGAGIRCSVSTQKCVFGCFEEPKFWETNMLFPRILVWKYLCFNS